MCKWVCFCSKWLPSKEWTCVDTKNRDREQRRHTREKKCWMRSWVSGDIVCVCLLPEWLAVTEGRLYEWWREWKVFWHVCVYLFISHCCKCRANWYSSGHCSNSHIVQIDHDFHCEKKSSFLPHRNRVHQNNQSKYKKKKQATKTGNWLLVRFWDEMNFKWISYLNWCDKSKRLLIRLVQSDLINAHHIWPLSRLNMLRLASQFEGI